MKQKRSERHPQMSEPTHVFRRRYPKMEKKNMEAGIYEGIL